MRSVEELVVLVTGATDGLGKMVARDQAAEGATVLLHGRSRERAEAVVGEIRKETGNAKLRYYLVDFSTLEEVRGLADEARSDHDSLHVLVNNADIIARWREECRDSFELTFAVNYLAPFLLTDLLLPLLRGSAPSRIVNVASAGQSPINFDDPMMERGYDAMRAYTRSKLAQVVSTFSLAERLSGTRVTVNALHPASLMDTKWSGRRSATR